jgi:HK97 family phage major capsid protein
MINERNYRSCSPDWRRSIQGEVERELANLMTLKRPTTSTRSEIEDLQRDLALCQRVNGDPEQRSADLGAVRAAASGANGGRVEHADSGTDPYRDEGNRGGGHDMALHPVGGDGQTRRTPGSEPTWVRTDDLQPAAVEPGQRFAEQSVVARYITRNAERERVVVGQHGNLGSLIRAMTTTSGSAIVPTVWLGDIIDRARAASAVLRAGATIVPMDAKVVNIGRLTGDPTAAFRTEGSTITPSDPTFDNVTLTAKTMSALVVGSLEWFQDADNANQVVSNAIAQAMAAELDRQALFGGVTTGGETGVTGFNTTFPTPPNPRGVLASLLADASSNVLGSGANGTVQTAATYFGELLDLLYTPRYNNEEPNALIANAKLFRQYAGAADTTNQPLRMPADLENVQRLSSNVIPSFTQGTMTTRATDAFAGNWAQLLIGQRLDVTVQTLTERYAENGQVGIVAHWRGDVGLARPRAFAVYRYLQGAL